MRAFDDDPEQLARAFPADEGEQFTPVFMAACIILYGRERVSLFPSRQARRGGS